MARSLTKSADRGDDDGTECMGSKTKRLDSNTQDLGKPK